MKEFSVIAFILFVSTGITGLTQRFSIGLICFLSLYLGWQLFHLLLLHRHLNDSGSLKPNKSFGIWGNIFSQLKLKNRQQLNNKHRLQELRIELFRFLETLHDAVIFLDQNKSILWTNRTAAELLSVSNSTQKGFHINQVIKDKILIDQLNTNQDRTFEILSPVNQSIILSMSIYHSSTMKQNATVLFARDITQVYYTERSRKDFVSNVSHELRTPVTVIKGFLELMSESEGETGEWSRSTELMQTQINRMENLIESLLLLNRIQQDQSNNQDKQVDVAKLLFEIISQAKILHKNKSPIFSSSVNENMCLLGSETYLISVFSNLIFNAIIHNSPQCKINISWQLNDQGGAVFIVQDQGEGIPTRHLNRLTERFYRVDKSRSHTKENSTGLGLAIVKHALQYHQGDLDIQSEIGSGSQFKCTFPESRVILQK